MPLLVAAVFVVLCFKNWKDLKQHLTTMVCGGDKNPLMIILKISYSSSSHLKKHKMSLDSTEITYTCETCNAKFNKKGNLTRHLSKKSNCEPQLQSDFHSVCNACNCSFTKQEDFKQHIKTVGCGGKERFPCNICDRNFFAFYYLKEHNKKNHDSTAEKYRCNTCNADFMSKTTLIRHLKKKSNCTIKRSRGIRRICSVCSSSFTRRRDFNLHEKKVGCGGHQRFPCDFCPKTFSQVGHWKTHKEIHSTARKKYVCQHCNAQFSQKCTLNTHLKRKPDCKHQLATGLKTICTICKISFTKRKAFKEHIKTVGCGGIERFLCNICNKTFSDSGGLKIHEVVHVSTGKNYSCEICNAKFTNKSNLLAHRKKKASCKDQLVNGIRRICSICDFSCTMSHKFKEHLKTVGCGGKERYQCNLCNKIYSQTGSLKGHQEVHDSIEKKYTCATCNAKFIWKMNLVEHFRRKTNCNRKIIRRICSICNCSFTKGRDFKEHLKTVRCGGQEMFPCNVCNKTFPYLTRLNIHQERHDITEKKYPCPNCDVRFTWKSSLSDHLKNTSNCKLKPPKTICSICTMCNSSFTKRQDFRDHITILGCGGDEKFPCKICNKSFTKSSYLPIHHKLHKRKKKYTCDICKAGFTQKSSFILHQRTSSACRHILSSSILKYTCHFCKLSFPKLWNLKKHIKTSGCGNGGGEVQVQSISPSAVDSPMTTAKDTLSALASSSSQIPSIVEVPPSTPLLEHTFKVYVFKNTSSIDFSTFISSKLDAIKNTVQACLESDWSEIKTAVAAGDMECIQIEGKNEEEVFGRFGPYRSQFIPIVNAQEIGNSVTLMLDEAMSHCKREGR